MDDLVMRGRRAGKTLIDVEASKLAQAQGRRVLWATDDQARTAAMLAKHGAISEVVGEMFVVPRFRRKPNG